MPETSKEEGLTWLPVSEVPAHGQQALLPLTEVKQNVMVQGVAEKAAQLLAPGKQRGRDRDRCDPQGCDPKEPCRQVPLPTVSTAPRAPFPHDSISGLIHW